jgi:hypothetical protein
MHNECWLCTCIFEDKDGVDARILGKDLQLVGNLGDCYYFEHGKSG